LGKITRALEKAAEDRAGRSKQGIPASENESNQSTVSAVKESPSNIAVEENPQEALESGVVNPVEESSLDGRLVTYFDPKALVSEQYKILATNFLSSNKGHPPQVISITSSIAGEGKTLTALNLAITLSKAVHKPRIMLVDADMRKSQLLKYIGMPARQGLSDFLNGQASIEEVVFDVGIENLSFISSGPTPMNPAELLASDRMGQLIHMLRQQYDFVLIDTPPVIPVTDAVIVGSNVEGVLVVIKAGRTQRGMVSRASELLLQTNANIIGYTLTDIEYFVPDYIYRYL
jgi:capsular exopolysaccharide synthesis family protein